MILIELAGEQLLVDTLDGYDGATVIAADVSLQPDDAAVLVDGAWAVPLAVLQDRKWAAAKATREVLETGTAPTTLGRVQIDEASKVKINGLLAMARLVEEAAGTFSEQFTMADNSVVTLDSTSVRQLAMGAAMFVSDVYAHARGLRAAIEGAASAADLDAIDIETGWPS